MTDSKILVVDDDAHIRQVLALKLRNAGLSLMTAADGEEALELARLEQPALVVTDLQMPYLDGLGLCRALAEDDTTAGIPVVLLTARGYVLTPEDMKAGNIVDVMSKPFSPRAVLARVKSLLEERRAA